MRYSAAFIYLLTAATSSLFWLSHNNHGEGLRLSIVLFWLVFCGIPLLFAFSYPRHLFSEETLPKVRKYAVQLHIVGITATTILFVVWGTNFWENPFRDHSDSLAYPLVALGFFTLFLVTALFLLFKGKSALARFSAFSFWFYWLLLSLIFLDRWYSATPLATAGCFLALAAAAAFAFATGVISYRPVFAHILALSAGVISIPWLYVSTIRGDVLGNTWLLFNVPDDRFRAYGPLDAVLPIITVGFTVLAIFTAALQMFPGRWQLRQKPIRERTWPAFVACFIFMAVWFTQSVMPYRIPGAVDYSDWPIFQILHVEKHGLQFQENSVNVWGRFGEAMSVSFSRNNRRWFQYKFQLTNESARIPSPLAQRIQSIIQSSKQVHAEWRPIKPVRNWNEEGYFVMDGSRIRAYTTANGVTAPDEMVQLFRELESLPKTPERTSELRDVCFGFCYDPPAGLGLLYANHRCSINTGELVCR